MPPLFTETYFMYFLQVIVRVKRKALWKTKFIISMHEHHCAEVGSINKAFETSFYLLVYFSVFKIRYILGQSSHGCLFIHFLVFSFSYRYQKLAFYKSSLGLRERFTREEINICHGWFTLLYSRHQDSIVKILFPKLKTIFFFLQ